MMARALLLADAALIAAVVVQFNWIYALGAVGITLVTVGLLSRVRRRRRQRL